MAFLNHVGEGVILKSEGGEYLVEDENGFEDWHPEAELVIRMALKVDGIQKKDEGIPSKGTRAVTSGKSLLEKDLHFHQLVEHPKNFSRFQKLDIQLREARKFLDRCKVSGNKRVVLIHGVGEGRLKEEIHTMLERMDNLRFYDASYADYGKGATEVEFY